MCWKLQLSINMSNAMFCVDNGIMPIERIALISNEETFIELHVVIIVAYVKGQH